MGASLKDYVDAFENTRRARRGGPARLERIREDALDRFLALGFPTVRDEEWRFTSVAPIADHAFALAPRRSVDAGALDLVPFRPGASTGAELVFVNGCYDPVLSSAAGLPPGVSVSSLAAMFADGVEPEPSLARVASFAQHAFTALNTAFLTDGAFIRVSPGTVVTKPIHVVFISTPGTNAGRTVSHPRVFAMLGEGSQASIVESYVAGSGTGTDGASPDEGIYFTNAVSELVVGENAVLDHYKLQQENARAYHVGTTHLLARRHATCASHSLSFGGSLVRNDVMAVLDGEGAQCTLNGLYVAGDRQLVDNHTTIDHAQPHCGSRELYKGILADRARGVFNGKIIVRPHAQQTDARQTNRALLLSEDAQVNSKPQLEIFANDVKCTHGAAVGQLDDEAVFYLRSRGLGALEARHLLVHAFAADVLSHLPLAPVREMLEEALQRRVAGALAAAA